MAIPKFFSAYNPPPGEGLDCSGDPGLTKQEFRQDCDINFLMKRYEKGGELPPDIGLGAFGDFYSAPDFQQAQELLARASEQFASLPAAVRAEFRNDPVELLNFVHGVRDEKSLKRAHELGLLKEVEKIPVVRIDGDVRMAPAVPPVVEKKE